RVHSRKQQHLKRDSRRRTEEQPMQIVHKYSRPACLSVNHPSHLGPGISFCVVDQDPVHM
ncbi:MAG: hypothetical protein WB776_05555, partial [Candidatus Sulfotelmatobacter sp.]